MIVKVIGAGLAGVEAANYLANKRIPVILYEMKPIKFSEAHKQEGFAELICSNSFKSTDEFSATGMLKREMSELGSIVMEAAYSCQTPAGNSLSVDRLLFSKYITDKLANNPLITIKREEIIELSDDDICIIATGPLTSDSFHEFLMNKLGHHQLHFYDAVAPIVDASTIDYSKVFYKSRYDKGTPDFLNCPMTSEDFDAFYQELIAAKTAKLHDVDAKVFEACMPIEVLAKRGKEAITFGPMKPVGLENDGKRYKAVVQLRIDDINQTAYNLVGFQTNLTFPEQKRVFSLIPGLENSSFFRYGVMHRNTYIESPKLINQFYQLKSNPNWFFAGQMTGVEGYLESASSGLLAAIYLYKYINNSPLLQVSNNTIMGALANYVSTSNKSFVPMNANLGIIPYVDIKNKKERSKAYASRSLADIMSFKKEIDE